MIVHTFAFRWKPGVPELQKTAALETIRGFQGQIPGLLSTYAGVNFFTRNDGYELGGTMQFRDRAALEAYITHPAHQALVSWLMPLIDPLEIDFDASAGDFATQLGAGERS